MDNTQHVNSNTIPLSTPASIINDSNTTITNSNINSTNAIAPTSAHINTNSDIKIDTNTITSETTNINMNSKAKPTNSSCSTSNSTLFSKEEPFSSDANTPSEGNQEIQQMMSTPAPLYATPLSTSPSEEILHSLPSSNLPPTFPILTTSTIHTTTSSTTSSSSISSLLGREEISIPDPMTLDIDTHATRNDSHHYYSYNGSNNNMNHPIHSNPLYHHHSIDIENSLRRDRLRGKYGYLSSSNPEKILSYGLENEKFLNQINRKSSLNSLINSTCGSCKKYMNLNYFIILFFNYD